MSQPPTPPLQIQLSEAYWQSVTEVYLREPGGEKDLRAELPQLRRFMPQIAGQLSGVYEFDIAVDRGGAGLVSLT